MAFYNRLLCSPLSLLMDLLRIHQGTSGYPLGYKWKVTLFFPVTEPEISSRIFSFLPLDTCCASVFISSLAHLPLPLLSLCCALHSLFNSFFEHSLAFQNTLTFQVNLKNVAKKVKFQTSSNVKFFPYVSFVQRKLKNLSGDMSSSRHLY